ncbi:hypothetical protein [Streptomyces sp. 150FB]|uniref:endonuclease/exonuclease/phosphatase family protein n=1 Tax=Streptomyces sp. 150FB TaxID=1576605 RepID=UPI0015695F4E|nr:hypothetical protein [Streptomyces sp. 150FB]
MTSQVRIGTYNVNSPTDDRAAAQIRMLAEHELDVLCLQEAEGDDWIGTPDRDFWAGSGPMLRRYADGLGGDPLSAGSDLRKRPALGMALIRTRPRGHAVHAQVRQPSCRCSKAASAPEDFDRTSTPGTAASAGDLPEGYARSAVEADLSGQPARQARAGQPPGS